MLGKYLKIGDETLPNPSSFSENFENIEEVNQSEGGTDLTSVTRLCKLNLSMSFKVSSTWKTKLIDYGKLAFLTLNYNGVDYAGRFRVESCELAEESDRTENTDGLWTLSVSFIQT